MRTAVLAVVLLAVAAGCRSTERVARTQVLVTIGAGSGVRAQAERLRIELSHGPDADAALDALEPEVFDLDGDFRWPASLALVPRSGSGELVFALRVVAEAGGDPIAEVRVASGFVEGKTLLLEMFLADACLHFFSCGDDETCVAEANAPICVPAHVDPKDLRVFEPGDGGLVGVGGPPDGGTGGTGGTGAGAQDGGGDAAPGDGGGDAGPGDGGGPPACEPTGPEGCFNRKDDDCDDDTDCADADCDDAGTCVPDGTTVGVLISSGATCPSGFHAGSLVVHRELSASDCAGCTCDVTAPDCAASVYYYASMMACTDDTALAAGTLVGTATFTCTPNPIGEEEGMYSPAGWRVGPSIDVTVPGTCSASGTANPGEPEWGEAKKFCRADDVGGGCDQDMVCVPAVAAGTLCGETTDADSCPADAEPSSKWYEDYDDTRTCEACQCDAGDGNCDEVQVFLGSDWTCNEVTSKIGAGGQDCTAAAYSPPAQLVGAATTPTCSARLSGELTGKDRHDFCCVP